MSAITVEDYPLPPDWIFPLLTAHLPSSLPLLRRLQFASRKALGVTTPTTHVLLARAADAARPPRFAAAYVDLSRGPETECWMYSTLEEEEEEKEGGDGDGAPADGLEAADCVDQVLALLRRVRGIEPGHDGAGAPRRAGTVMVGSLHEAVRQALIARGVVVLPTGHVPVEHGWDFYDKWLFRVEELPASETALPEGMGWDTIRDTRDTAIVRARTGIPRKDATLLLLPNAVLRQGDGAPIAWAFLGLDGSLTSLHCEEQYRGRGLAKALASKLMRDRVKEFGDDGWGSADVSPQNLQSRGVCTSLGGKPVWTVSWLLVDLTTVGDPL